MNETKKTAAFVVVALAAVAWAVLATWTPGDADQAEDLRGQLLFPDFKEPLDVASLEIITFDEDNATVHPFMVAEADVKGKTYWVIPSHDNYPADAKDQVAAAAAGLMGLTVLEVASENIGDQREYGVVDPDSKTLKVGDTGVGRRVVMRDKEGKELLSLVIGKEVAGQAGQVYVRKPDENQIYVVEAKTDRLSTKFDDWIEKNLLGINSWDMKQIWIRDYSVDLMNQELAQRGDAKIEYDDAGQPRWKLLEARKFVLDQNNPENDRFEPIKLAADQELDAARLDELKTALDDLKIVDVAPKPAGLSADLRAAADFSSNREAVQSLAKRGFYVAKLEGRVELFSNQGEIRVTMKDGVEYVLRFGEIAGRGASQKDDKKDNGDKEEEKDKTPGVNRYLFVTAEFNPDIVPKPELEPLPELKPADKPAEEKTPAAEAKDAKTDEKQPDEKAAAEKDEKPAEPAQDAKAIEAQRKQIELENKRKQDEYERIVADGKRRVAELNARFADWYYIIDEGVFRRIHLNRDELIKKKEPKKDKRQVRGGDQADQEPPMPETDEPPLPAAPVAPEEAETPQAEEPKEPAPPATAPPADEPQEPAPAEPPKAEPPVAPDPPPPAKPAK